MATKFAVMRGEDGSFLGVSGRPEYVHEACDRSLQRLGVDHIDYTIDPEVEATKTHWQEVSTEFTLGAASFEQLVDAVLVPMDLKHAKRGNKIRIAPKN